MELPQVSDISVSRDVLQEFQGYNHNYVIADNQFYNMKNLSSSLYPVLSPRGRRGNIRRINKPNGLFAKERLFWVDGTKLYYNGEVIAEVTDTEKQFVSMGAYVLIFPDKTVYNTSSGEYKNLGAIYESISSVSFQLCRIDGNAYQDYLVSNSLPAEEELSNGMLWLDTSSEPHVLKQYSESSGSWSAIPTTFVKISSPGLGEHFNQYDAVTISGCTDNQFNADMIVFARDTDYIVVAAIIDEIFTQDSSLKIERRIPDMEFLTENENRVWGCSSEKHEIYACKQGDPFNWYCYMGISTDSYAVTVGSDGFFTGAYTHLGYVLFFKDKSIIKIYGSQPSNYQLTTVNCRGVQGGCSKSLVTVNETLYYKGRDGICAYDGSLPAGVSDALGSVLYKSAAAGAIGGKYYVSMSDDNDVYYLFVYDTARGMWHVEDNTQAHYFASLDGDLYFIDQNNDLICVNASNGEPEKSIEWMAETGDLGMNSPDHKYISKIQLRLYIALGSKFSVDVQYDSSDRWNTIANITSMTKNSQTVFIQPMRCDHMRIRMRGTGDFKLYSISKITEQGSEI